VFIDSGAAWNKSNDIQQLTGTGVQITIETKLGYGLTLPVTLGYAHGFDEDLGKEQFYLNVSGVFW
jgi:outer membrane translocation and assembly module TamA